MTVPAMKQRIMNDGSGLFVMSPQLQTMPAPEQAMPNLAGGLQQPDDPLYSDQWHLPLLGDIETIWEDYTGAGIRVAVYDDGLQTSHPDLASSYDFGSNLSVFLDVNGDGVLEEYVLDPLEPTQLYQFGHGTSVAGLIAAANNGEGSVGVAFGATLTGVPILGLGAGDINYFYEGFLQTIAQSGNFDVINHSWGKAPGFFQATIEQDQQLLSGWFDALENGRGGLGVIVV
mgnify:CR=1 FL=1